MKRLLLLFLISALFVGCTATEASTTFSPTPEPSNIIISYEPAQEIVVLSYPDAELEGLNRITYETIHEGNTIAYTTVYSLLAGKNAEDNYIPFSKTARIKSFFVSRNVALIDITADLSELTQRQYFCSVISLVNTLTEIEAIEYVKLKINGEDFSPIGIFTNPLIHFDRELDVLYLQHMNSIANNSFANNNGTLSYLLYFTDLSGKFLLTEVRTGYSSGENLAVDLINQLKNGPSSSDEMKTIIPTNAILQNDPQVHEDGEYGNILTITLEMPKHEAMDSEARYMMAATIVSTMQSNISGIDAVRVFINSQPAISTSIMKQDDFINLIGNISTLYFPNTDYTHLIPIKRTLSQEEYKLKEKRVEYLIQGLLSFESTSAQNIFPDSITLDDLLFIKVAGSIAYVNFSSDLVLSCDYSEAQERMLIYSIVNTLSEIKQIKKVQILINGEVTDTLCGNLSAQEPYLPNPGIIQR